MGDLYERAYAMHSPGQTVTFGERLRKELFQSFPRRFCTECPYIMALFHLSEPHFDNVFSDKKIKNVLDNPMSDQKSATLVKQTCFDQIVKILKAMKRSQSFPPLFKAFVKKIGSSMINKLALFS